MAGQQNFRNLFIFVECPEDASEDLNTTIVLFEVVQETFVHQDTLAILNLLVEVHRTARIVIKWHRDARQAAVLFHLLRVYGPSEHDDQPLPPGLKD